MRPRKQVVLWAGDEERASILKFVLETEMAVRVRIVRNRAEFKAQAAKRHAVDLVLLLAGDGGPDATDAVFAFNFRPHQPVVAIGGDSQNFLDLTCLTQWCHDNIPMTELMDRCHVWLARKRGPKPCQPAAPAVELVASVAR